MTRYRCRERSFEREGSEMSRCPSAHRGKRSRSERPSDHRGLQKGLSRSCGLASDAEEPSLQPYVIRGGQRVRCRCGKRDGLQDDIPPPRKKIDGPRASPDAAQASSAPGDPVRPAGDNSPPPPAEDAHPPPACDQPLLPDVCPLCRNQTYNLPTLLRPPTTSAGGAALALPDFCPCPRPWPATHPQPAPRCLCRCGQPLGGAQGLGARRLQCCGEAAADIAERIEKSLQDASALAAKSDAKRRTLSRGADARETAKRTASVSPNLQQLDCSAEACLKTDGEAKLPPATHGTPVYATTVPNAQTLWPLINHKSTNFSREIHETGSLDCSKNVQQPQTSLERSRERHRHASPKRTGAGDRSSSPGPQYKCNWWCVPPPSAQFGSQNIETGNPNGFDPDALISPYTVVCPHHPQWHSVCKCVHRIPFVLQTHFTPGEGKQMETDVGNSALSHSSQNLHKNGAKLLREINKHTFGDIQRAGKDFEGTSNESKELRKLESTKTNTCCKAMATQTFISCVKNALAKECDERTTFASRGIMYAKVDDFLQIINPDQRDAGTQTILTAAKVIPSCSLGIAGTACKGTVCGSFVRTIGPSNSVQSVSGLQTICPIVHKLIPSPPQSVKSTSSKGTICNRSERVVQPTHPEGKEIAIQAGGSILQQLRASKSLELTNSVQRPISRPRSLSSTSTPCSSSPDVTTHQSETTFPLLSRPEDILGLPYFSWPSTAATTSVETLQSKECGLQPERDVRPLCDGKQCIGGATSETSPTAECATPAPEKPVEETVCQVTTTSVNSHPQNHRRGLSAEPPKRNVSACKGSAVLAKNRREKGGAGVVVKALQPKNLKAETHGQAQGAKAAVSAARSHRPPAKRPLEFYVTPPQEQCLQREANQKIKTNTADCERKIND